MKIYALSLLTLVCMSAGLSATHPPHVEGQPVKPLKLKKAYPYGSFVGDLFRIATGSAFVAGGIYALLQAQENYEEATGIKERLKTAKNNVVRAVSPSSRSEGTSKAAEGVEVSWLSKRSAELGEAYKDNKYTVVAGAWGTTGLTSLFVGLKLVLRGLHLTK